MVLFLLTQLFFQPLLEPSCFHPSLLLKEHCPTSQLQTRGWHGEDVWSGTFTTPHTPYAKVFTGISSLFLLTHNSCKTYSSTRNSKLRFIHLAPPTPAPNQEQPQEVPACEVHSYTQNPQTTGFITPLNNSQAAHHRMGWKGP